MKHTWRSICDLSSRSFVAILLVSAAGIGLDRISWVAAAETSPLPQSAPVKVLPRAAGETETPMQGAMEAQSPPPQPTLPGGKLPQYQLDYRHRMMPSVAELQDARLRFLLVLPSRPILLEAHITIDGHPFPMIRERRIEDILAEAAQPAPQPNGEDPVRTSGDAEGENGSAEDPAPNPPDGRDDEDQSANEDGASQKEPAQENELDEGPEGEPEEPERPPLAPPTVPPYVPPATAADFVRRYTAAMGRDVLPEEVRWLLTNRLDGPTLLMLNDNFQRFRAHQRPVFDVLDRNRDGVVAAEELEKAVSSFQECDRNRDDIVAYTELAAVAADANRRKPIPGGPGKLIFERSDLPELARALAKSDGTGSGKALPVDPTELVKLWDGEPDVVLAVAFNTADPSRSTLTVNHLSQSLNEASVAVVTHGNTVTLTVEGTPVAFSAIQRDPSDQVSVGAVIDGYPILPVIDPDDDGRFTIREMRSLVERLRAFDRNQDGRLTVEENPSPLRVCFGLGPLVHNELADIRSVNRPAKGATTAGPEWFVRMDRNRDNDLTRNEFPGTDEQFAAMDADNDALISVDEAVRFDRQSQDSKP